MRRALQRASGQTSRQPLTFQIPVDGASLVTTQRLTAADMVFDASDFEGLASPAAPSSGASPSGAARALQASKAAAALQGQAIPGYAYRFAEAIGPAVQNVLHQPVSADAVLFRVHASSSMTIGSSRRPTRRFGGVYTVGVAATPIRVNG